MCGESAAPTTPRGIPDSDMHRIVEGLRFVYPHTAATTVPSKQTATQLKGREKDSEVAENTVKKQTVSFRRPSFVAQKTSAQDRRQNK